MKKNAEKYEEGDIHTFFN